MYLHINLQLLQPDCFSSGTISYTSLETRNIGHNMLSLARKSLIFLRDFISVWNTSCNQCRPLFYSPPFLYLFCISALSWAKNDCCLNYTFLTGFTEIALWSVWRRHRKYLFPTVSSTLQSRRQVWKQQKEVILQSSCRQCLEFLFLRCCGWLKLETDWGHVD